MIKKWKQKKKKFKKTLGRILARHNKFFHIWMFLNFSHNYAGKKEEEEEEDPHMKILTPYSKYSLASLTRLK